jgi:small subunit ribosomal protein S20
MANIKSAKKDIITNERNRKRNSHYISRVKTFVKKAQIAIESKADNRAELVATALKIIDKTVGKGILHKKTAARKKSRLALALNQSQA